MSGVVRLEYCKPCLDAAAHGDMPAIPSHIFPAKASAVRPCVACGERRFMPHGYTYAYAGQDAACGAHA